MIKYIILLAMPLLTNTCLAAHDSTYYSTHLKELQKAIEFCPEKHPAGVSCEELNISAQRTNELVSELQYNPQGFGQKILTLQESLAKLTTTLQTNPGHPEALEAAEQHKLQLSERLAIVKWLESPRG